MNINSIDGSEQDILIKYSTTQLEGMVKQYNLVPFFMIHAKLNLKSLTVDQALDYLCEASILRNEWERNDEQVNICSEGSIATFHKVWKNCVQSNYLTNIAIDIDSVMGSNFPTMWSILKQSK